MLPSTDTDLYVEVAGTGRVMTLSLVGTVDMYTRDVFLDRVRAEIEHKVWSMVVNLAEVAFFDSEVGVGALLRALRHVQVGGGTLLLAEVPEQVHRAIRARGLGLVLHAFPTEDAAVEFLTLWRRAP